MIMICSQSWEPPAKNHVPQSIPSPSSLSSGQCIFNLNVHQSDLEGSGKQTVPTSQPWSFWSGEVWNRAWEFEFLSSRWYWWCWSGDHTLGSTSACNARNMEPRRPNFLVHSFLSADSTLLALSQSKCYQTKEDRGRLRALGLFLLLFLSF